MPVEMLIELEQQAYLSNQETAEDWRLTGETDAALGIEIAVTNAAYLDGYFAELRKRAEAGERFAIRWILGTAPAAPAYASGYEDVF